MKKILSSLLIAGALSFAACNNETKADKATETVSEKEHVCTDKCKDGTHFYAHGEKGHTCTDECKKES